jgi:hypothetical protein
MLDPQAYVIETASTYDEARKKLSRNAFHVVISDQRLVDTDPNNIQGIELLDIVNSLGDGTQALIVTGYPTVEAAKEAIRGRDAFDYVLKRPEKGGPFNIREYRETVQRAMSLAEKERQAYMTLRFSLHDHFPGLTYEAIAYHVSAGIGLDSYDEAIGDIKGVVNRLLYSFQPLARGVGRTLMDDTTSAVGLFLWSRKVGQAGLVHVGTKDDYSIESDATWLRPEWSCDPVEKVGLGKVTGHAYRISGMSYDQLASFDPEAA